MTTPLIDRKYLLVSFRYPSWRRKWKIRHSRSTRSLYVQILKLEVVVWYR